MKKKVEEENAKPSFYSNEQGDVIKRGRAKYYPDKGENGTMGMSMNACICHVSDMMDDKKAAAELIAAAMNEKYEKEGWT